MGIKEKFEKFFYGNEASEYVNDVEENEDDFYPTQTQETVAEKTSRPSGVSVTTGSSIEMKVVKPDSMASVIPIADQLRSGKTILLNLEDTNKETAHRLIDFLHGVSYAINGDLKKVANCTYVITPSNVDVSGEQLKDTKDFE